METNETNNTAPAMDLSSMDAGARAALMAELLSTMTADETFNVAIEAHSMHKEAQEAGIADLEGCRVSLQNDIRDHVIDFIKESDTIARESGVPCPALDGSSIRLTVTVTRPDHASALTDPKWGVTVDSLHKVQKRRGGGGKRSTKPAGYWDVVKDVVGTAHTSGGTCAEAYRSILDLDESAEIHAEVRRVIENKTINAECHSAKKKLGLVG